ncbi:toll/interleukin-1 receptor domain-containing protein [Streptomyces sp. S3(2020)]|uniref:TIR domain-containing protein n=1 Tax=Streptomyces sp. S3(2020) TaxID=2732044 RepID=UPI001489D534|nr:TIR domain-containing protein [Streptomyces sp. S3(2020)]NNN36926.1 toll/interleukin-1 receptor domain-containing protein [Streptomyces sp. S3(2020)]
MSAPLPPESGSRYPGAPAANPENDFCWYFLSYSEQRDLRSRVERFHRDLQSEVHGLLGRNGPGGFMDVEDIETSERWRPRIWNSARQVPCMVVLYSVDYFGSDWCGREWAVFVERIRRRETQGGKARHLIALVWRRGPKPWPSGADDFQYFTWKTGSMYEDHGLFHVVPPDGAAAGEEYWAIVRAVALMIANAVVHPEIPAISEEEARTVVPLFGERALRPVDIVVSYAEPDSDWGSWMAHQLRSARYTVDTHVLSERSSATVHVIRNSLQRARKVIVALSEHYLATGDMNDAALDEALSDESSDWQRLFPVVLPPGLDRSLPARIRELSAVRIGGRDAAAARETLLRVANAPGREAQRPPAFPGLPDPAPGPGRPGGGPTGLSGLVDALEKAVSVKEASVRGAWLAKTGLDLGSVNPSFPLRPLLFEIARVCRAQTGSYERLADALEKLEPNSAAARAVRDALTTPRSAAQPNVR